MESTVRRLLNNLGSMILALLLAFVVWISATLQANPFVDREVTGVPVAIVNRPQNTIVTERETEQVSVSVRLRQNSLPDLTPPIFAAVMDLSGVEIGVDVVVPIVVTSTHEAMRILSWSPAQQRIRLETLETMTVPVVLEIEGQVATGYEALGPQITPAHVSVFGPQPLVRSVVAVHASLDLDGARDEVLTRISVAPQDAEGRLVAGLQWSPDRVDVQVPVRRRVGFKPDVQVVPDLRGQPAPSYRLGSVSVEPSTVTLVGLPSVLDRLPGFVETMPISVTGATQDLSQRTVLTLPTTVAVVGGNFVTVTVEVLPIQSSRAMTATVQVRGVGPGRVASPSPPVVDVILEGPDAILSQLTADSIQVLVSLMDSRLGLYRLSPELLAPEGIEVVSIIPETIEVLVEIRRTPTPEVPLTPTAPP
jgi:YbbR domain-containing protein